MPNLSVLAFANGFTLWHYRAGAEFEVVRTLDFFGPARDVFAPGDIVMVSSANGAAILTVTTTAPVSTSPIA